jgi:hypothetical protein
MGEVMEQTTLPGGICQLEQKRMLILVWKWVQMVSLALVVGRSRSCQGVMDFSSQFLQDPEWFFDSSDWTGMPGDTMDFGEL